MCHSDNFPGPRGADLICIHININLHRNWIRDECAQLLLLCIYNKLHCKCWQHFTKQRGRQNILCESKRKWSTIFLKMVLHVFPKVRCGHSHQGMQLGVCQMATAFAWMAKKIWSSAERNVLWSVFGGTDFFPGMEIRILEFLCPPLTLYLNTYFFTDLHEFHLSEICTERGKVSLMFLSTCWLTVYPLELAFMWWVLSLCCKRGCNTAADSRARQGKFAVSRCGQSVVHSRVTNTTISCYFIPKERSPSEKTLK